MKKIKSKKQMRRSWIITLSVIVAVTLILNVVINIFSGYADLYIGKGKAIITAAEGTENWDSEYYTLDYKSEDDLKAAAGKVVEELVAEGAVLLKNNGVLPLKSTSANKKKITLLGRDSVDSVFGGSGSGSVDVSTVIDLKTALLNSHYDINEEVYSLFDSFASYKMGRNSFGQPVKKYDNPKADIVMDKPEVSTYTIGEMPASYFTESAINSFKSYNDAAIITFGRGGGEGGDLTKDMYGFDDNYTIGQHQLELNKDEKDLLEIAKVNFDKVIVLINSSTPMELGILEDDPKIDAVLWIGSPGQTGFNAVGDILNGTVNPSGKTVDIYARDFTKDPTFVNFGNYQYSNISRNNSYGDGFFVEYEEGIYIGYKYYETAAYENFIDYDSAVVYPFGYGLSYTEFDWEIVNKELGNVDGSIKIDVKVTNVGDYPGKDVVELFYSAPYTKGGIEKSSVEFADFAKTSLLKPGESETLSLQLSVEDMASYDYKDNRAYVLEEGEYKLLVQTDSHNKKIGLDEIVYTVSKTVVYNSKNPRNSDDLVATNQFDDVSKELNSMSRSDFEGTFPTAPTAEDLKANSAVLEAFAPYFVDDHIDSTQSKPVTGEKNGVSLINMRGLDFDDPLWDTLLNQLTTEEILAVTISAAYNTGEIESVGKPATVDLDGPAGLNSFMGASLHGIAYPSAVVISSSFNKDLAFKMGEMLGNEGLFYGVNGWYGPAANIHRSPFAGRNFEYYSEDGVLSGKIAAKAIEGAASKGVYSFMKHFALNDQETNRTNNGVSTWADEQAIREIYLKPFEIAVKTARNEIKYISDNDGTISQKEIPATTAIMSSFNRVGGTWAGGSSALVQTVLRDEWGFTGFVLSDFNLYSHMNANQGLAAGTDLQLTMTGMKSYDDEDSATTANYLRRAAHRLFYTVAHSNAMNGIIPGSTVKFTTAPWKIGLIVFNIIMLLLIVLKTISYRNKRKSL